MGNSVRRNKFEGGGMEVERELNEGYRKEERDER